MRLKDVGDWTLIETEKINDCWARGHLDIQAILKREKKDDIITGACCYNNGDLVKWYSVFNTHVRCYNYCSIGYEHQVWRKSKKEILEEFG